MLFSRAGQTKSTIPDEAPGWEEALASDSEAVVKAERAPPKDFKAMQEQTVHCLEEAKETPEEGCGTSEAAQQGR